MDYNTLIDIVMRDHVNPWDLLGVLLVPIISYIISRGNIQDSRIRFLISLLTCAIAGVIVEFPHLKYESIGSLLASASLIFTAAKIFYQLLWKDSKFEQLVTGDAPLKG